MAELKIKKSTAGSAPTTLEERTLGIHSDNLYFGSSTGTAIKLAKSSDIPTNYVSTTNTGVQSIQGGLNIGGISSINTTSNTTMTTPALTILHTGPATGTDYADLAILSGFKNAPYGLRFRTYGDGTAIIQSQRINSTTENFALSLNPNGGAVLANGQPVVTSNDSRLSDSRTPKSHNHGNITNSGAITSTAVETASGILVYDVNSIIQKVAVNKACEAIGAAKNNHDHDSTYLKLAGGTLTGPVNFSSTTPSTFKVHPTSENGLPLGVVDISNITAVNTPPTIDTSTAHEMPIIRMGPVLFSSTDGSISNEYPLTLKVEVIGGTLREGDELQLCGMKLYTWRKGTIRKYKMRQFITRVITADDIGKRYLTIQVSGAGSRDLLSGGWYPYSQTPNPTSRTRHPKYLRIRRVDPDNADNAFFSNAISFYAYGAYDKDNRSSKGRVSIR